MNAPATQNLYSRDVLRLAMSLPYNDRLEHPCLSATGRAPLCGSEMSVDLVVQDQSVMAIAIRARACALGQASAAILRASVVGHKVHDIKAMATQVEQALKGEADMPQPYQPLSYARDYPARHGAILLPFEVLLAAVEGTQG